MTWAACIAAAGAINAWVAVAMVRQANRTRPVLRRLKALGHHE